MNILGKAKGFLFEGEDDDVPSAPVQKSPTVPLKPATVQSVVVNTAYVAASAAPAGGGHFKDALAREVTNNFVNTPYSLFQKMNNGMKPKIADSSARLMAIGTSMEIQGITKQVILDDANKVIAFLNNEANSFNNDLNSSVTEIDTKLKSRSEAIAQSVQQKQDQIKSLQDDILNLQKEKSELEISSGEAKTKLEMSRVEFSGALNALNQEINNDINDITRYIGG